MQPRHWLLAALASLGALGMYACSAETTYESDDERSTAGDDGDDDGLPPKRDAGSNGTKSDARAPIATNEDDLSSDRDGDTEESVCDQVSIQAKSNPPDVLIVLDRSSSMQQGNRWAPSANAVKMLTAELNDAVNFGLMLFPAPGAMAGVAQGILDSLGLGVINGVLPQDTGCAVGRVVVPLKANNSAAIGMALDRGGPQGIAYTPTATSLDAARMSLSQGTCADCADRPKYVLLVTDGEPTCGATPQTGTPAEVDATNASIDKLLAAGIKTYVVGYNTKASPAADAAMNSFAVHGGTEKYLAVENGNDLTTELRRIAGSLVSCEYELNEAVSDPALVRVIIDGKTLILNEGWTLEGRKVILQEACDLIKDAKIHQVQIRKDCEPRSFL